MPVPKPNVCIGTTFSVPVPELTVTDGTGTGIIDVPTDSGNDLILLWLIINL